MIVGSGTFHYNGLMLISIETSDGFVTWIPGGTLPAFPGAWTAVGISGNNHTGKWTCSLLAGYSTVTLTGTGIATGTHFIDNPPPGFKPTTNIKGNPSTTYGFTTVGGGESVSADMGLGSSAFTSSGPASGALPLADFPDNMTHTALVVTLLIVDAHVIGMPLTAGSGVDTVPSADFITGNYVIEYWWWIKPDKDACGNKQDSHLVLAGDAPDGTFERLDPNDPDAHPTPVITSVDPNHGPTAGGNVVAIIGSGFGDAATVTFGGVTATGVNVVSQYRIECDPPAHAAGSANVVVTNADGVHS